MAVNRVVRIFTQPLGRWLIAFICCCVTAPLSAAVIDIVGLPDNPDERYDLTWDMTVGAAPTSGMVLDIEREKSDGGRGYQLCIENSVASWWQQTDASAPAPVVKAPAHGKKKKNSAAPAPISPLSLLVKAPAPLAVGAHYTFSFKRRPDTIALLQNHRLVFSAPAPKIGDGHHFFLRVPDAWKVGEARYRQMAKPIFGDNFMRPEGMRHKPTPEQPWTEDDTWKVAYYRKDWPVNDPHDPVTKTPMTTPWELSYFTHVDNSTKGFWFRYRGTGPSWVVANETMIYPTWDQYFVEASVMPEYDSMIGLLAAYQDNKNYILFRWKQREYVASNAVRAELVAMVNGEEHVLDSSPRGFEPNQWYRLRINLGLKQVQALVDDEVLLSAANPGPVEGRVGLFSNGSKTPRRLKLDELTATMYMTTDKTTGRVINDAADALRTSSQILFGDVRVGEWLSVPASLDTSPYAVTTSGAWTKVDDMLKPQGAARLLTGCGSWDRYSASTRVRVGHDGSVGVLFDMDQQNNGYLWSLSTYGQVLRQVVNNVPGDEVDRSSLGLTEGESADLRVDTDGPYVRLYFNNEQVLENYDRQRTHGYAGFLATSSAAYYSPLSITLHDPPRRPPAMNELFKNDRYLVAWSSADADWYPAVLPKTFVTPQGYPHSTVGFATPLPSDQPGVYWHKGGQYHDLRVTIPATLDSVAGQMLHLSTNYDSAAGYRLQLTQKDNQGQVRLIRGADVVGDYTYPLAQKSQLVFERLGNFLVLRAQELDTSTEPPLIKHEQLVFAYRDRAPLKMEMIGFTVTSPKLSAAQVRVESDRVEDTFEESPVGWVTESGVWAVMARYSCQPQWNWFGGFGPYTPTVWTKRRLDGNQTVEVYMGIKMQFDNMPEEEARRFRDTNVSICADGSHLNSGYSVIRAGRPNGHTATMLLRKDMVVKTTTLPEHLLPSLGLGHRGWFATRIEKRGGEIKVFLDNKLAMTYVDPDPIPGGYAAMWTLNNGIMLGRVNYSAEKMTVGTPRPAAPLAVQEPLDSLPMPQVTVDEVPIACSNFEEDMGDFKERPGITGRTVRERVNDVLRGPNTIVKVVNMYPAGDCSAALVSTERNLEVTPILHFDYCFDPGARVNLYVRKAGTWFELLMTGKEAQEPNVYTAGRLSAAADGAWHHLEVNLGKLITDAVQKQTGKEMFDPTVQEIVVADWSAPSDVRCYGFGNNPGGIALRFDNIVLVPLAKAPVRLHWSLGDQQDTVWRIGLDSSPNGLPTKVTSERTLNVTPTADQRFFHLQAKDKDGKWGPVMHIPLNLQVEKKE